MRNHWKRLPKILRINADGSVPADNPFVGTPDARGEIWAYGLRNPFTGDIDPVTGRMYINDVGQHRSEEINLGVAGANYGWPDCEGECENPDFEDPIYAYSHGTGCAITGGAFYRGTQFPEEYQGSYFFADLCKGWIKRLLSDGTAADFVTEGPKIVVDLEVGLMEVFTISCTVRAVRRDTSPMELLARFNLSMPTSPHGSSVGPSHIRYHASGSKF
jgi:glucose/arabinose dehydrogenase